MLRTATALIFLVAITANAQAEPVTPAVPAPATRPASEPSLLPPPGAPTLAERLGRLDALTFRYPRRQGKDIEYWDVVVTDRALLARIEGLRRSDWRDPILQTGGWDASARCGDVRYAGNIGTLKIPEEPLILRVIAPDRRWSLFMATGRNARDLWQALDDAALKQRPAEPLIERRGD